MRMFGVVGLIRMFGEVGEMCMGVYVLVLEGNMGLSGPGFDGSGIDGECVIGMSTVYCISCMNTDFCVEDVDISVFMWWI